MRVEFLVFHLVDQVAKSVGMNVQIRMVDLENITGEDEFSAISRPGLMILNRLFSFAKI